MQNQKNRVLIVDDSSFMGQLLRNLLGAENFTVEVARNGQEAIELVRSFRPHVVTMDIEMPVMSGLEALEVIMAESPLPVIMVSAQTVRGAKISLRALELGAFDIVAKPNPEDTNYFETFRRELMTKVKIALLVPPEKLVKPILSKPVPIPGPNLVPNPAPNPARTSAFAALLIGTSTGGPTALQQVLTQLPQDFPLPVLVVQHMPPNFTKLMAERLDSLCPLDVKEAEDRDAVAAGRVLIAPGGRQMALALAGTRVVVRISKDSPAATPYKPSVNVLFRSAAEIYGKRTLALVLTGMGSDGLEGSGILKQQGACIVAESEDTCIVYGMSKSVVEAGLADKVLPLSEIARFVMHKVYSERSVGDES